MSISNFDFPKVTLKQVFEPAQAAAVNALGVACIGPVYKYNDPDNTEMDIDWDVSGSEVEWTGLLPDGTISNPGHFSIIMENGIWQYYEVAGTYSVSATNVIRFDSPDDMDNTGRQLSSGDYVLIEKGGVKELRRVSSRTSVVDAEGNKVNFRNAIVLGETDYLSYTTDTNGIRSYSDGTTLTAGSVISSITLCLVSNWKGAIESTILDNPSADVTKKVKLNMAPINELAVKDVFSGYYSEDTASDLASFKLVALEAINSGKIAVRYRGQNLLKGNASFGTVSSLADVNTVLGPASVDNPVALACYFAIAAGGGTVYYKGVETDEDSGAYVKAISYLERYDAIYSIVPCTETSEIIQACNAQVQAVSDDVESKTWYTLWYGASVDTENDRTNAGQIEYILSRRVTNHYRAQCVWADGAEFEKQSLNGHNYALAAAAAGMRAGQPVHRPLSNLGYSFFTINEDNTFTKSELKDLGRNGIWIIANNTDGSPINMRQVTTAAADSLNMDEESCVANADDVAMSMSRLGANMIGCSNISKQLLLLLSDSLVMTLNSKKVDTYGTLVGPQIVEWELIRAPYQDPVNLDHVLADVSITPPKPFNQFRMTLRVL